MASREASLKVTLRTGAFASGVRSMSDMVSSAGRRMGSSLSGPMSKGFDAAKRSFGDMGRSLKQGAMQVATLGGAVGVGMFVRDAITLEAHAGKVAMQLRHMGGAAGSIEDPLTTAREAGEKFKATTGEMLTAYEMLLAGTGDPVFSKNALESVALMSNAFRMSTEQSTQFVASLQEQGIAAGAIKGEILPALLDLTNRGGVGMEDVAQASGKILGQMAALGLKGKDGFGQIVGMLNITDSQGGAVEERLGGIGKVLLALQQKSFFKDMNKQVGGLAGKLSPANGALQNMQEILKKKGGLEALQQKLGKSAKTAGVFNVMVQPYVDAMNAAAAQGKSADVQIAMASAALAESLKHSTETTATEATLRDEAAKRTSEKSRVFELAIDRMKDAFANPQMLGAIDKLVANLPALAEKVANLVGWISANPGEAAAAIVLGRVALAFGGAAIQSAVVGGARALFAAAAGTAAAGTAAAGASTAAAGAAGAAGVGGAATAAGAGGAAAVTAGGAMLGAAIVAPAAIIAGGIIAAEKGQRGEMAAGQRAELAVSSADTLGKGASEAKISQALAELAVAKSGVKSNESTMSNILGAFVGEGSPNARRDKQLAEIAAAEERLKKSLATLRESADKLGGAMNKAAGGTTAFASTATTRGPLNPPASQPGAAPTGG